MALSSIEERTDVEKTLLPRKTSVSFSVYVLRAKM
jgi:hypothetical protein